MSAREWNIENCLQFLAENGYDKKIPAVHTIMQLEASSPGERSLCEGLAGVYSNGIHIGSIFLILGVSFLGTAIPIASKFIPAIGRYPFVFTIAKTAATGVLLSVSTIHLIHEGAMAFREPCMNETLKLYEPAYFLFALVAALLMQMLDIQLDAIAERWMKTHAAAADHAAENLEIAAEEEADDEQRQRGVECAAGDVRRGENTVELDVLDCGSPVTAVNGVSEEPTNVEKPQRDGVPAALATVEQRSTSPQPFSEPHTSHTKEGGCDAHGHQHLSVRVPRDMGSVRRVISAICMEFGVALHSVFVGLAIGLTTDAELKPLLVALVFHQMFEGMALGSRLADAEFKGSLEIVLALVFSVSAPVGMAAATIAVSVSRDAMSGSGFVTMMGVLDSLCGGILMYLAFTLLLGDFVADMKHYCADGQPYRVWKKTGMFLALWIGMGLMALVGNWL